MRLTVMRAGDFRCTCHSLSPGQVVVNRGRQTWRERIDYEVAFSGGSMGGGGDRRPPDD